MLARIKVLQKFRDLIYEHQAELATCITLENGKALKESTSEVIRTVEYIDYTIEEAKRMNPQTYSGAPFGASHKLGIFKRVPKGVILAIAPFNYPVNLAVSKIAPALIVGNTVVFKPATNGSMSGCYLAKLFAAAEFPPGTINVVTGRGSDIGDALITNPEINLIAFTGSVNIGEHIKKINNGIDLVLELGGKDPMLVLADADIEQVAKDIITGGFGYSGQRCTAIKLVIVMEDVADQLIAALKPLVAKLTVGSGIDNCNIVPLITESAAEYVQCLIDDAIAKKATLVCGNKRAANLLHPTVLDHVTLDMKIASEEPFGPVIPIVRVRDHATMLKVANNSEFGLQASIYTKDMQQAFLLADELEVGTVNFNSKSQRGPDSFPFLGVKKSGQGVQGIHDTLKSVTRPKGYVINY